jgi:hypothetical protein
MKISVTQKHINKGKRAYSDSCPIALAVRELGYPKWTVGSRYIYSPFDVTIELPKSAQKFIKVFDRRGGRKLVKPFAFIARLPKP